MKKFILKLRGFLKRMLILGFQFSLLAVVIYRVFPVPFTPLMLQRMVENHDTVYQLKKIWKPINQMGFNIPVTVVTSEDPKFFNHYGFDFGEIKNSIEDNMESGKRLRGASTITQQTAKNIFLLPVRSFIRKGIEVYFTILLEVFWNKKRILEVYLNIIETGYGIFGMSSACNIYFKKDVSRVTPGDAALMVAVLPNPIRWRPDKPDGLILLKKNNLLYLRTFVDQQDFYWIKK